jgi:hypothetical protein
MSAYQLGDFCIDDARPIKVVVIGAGFSGALSIHLLEFECLGLSPGIISGIR